MKNIVLVGMMGAGKTSVGKRLAERAGMRFLDCDQLYFEKHGEDIATTFQRLGEEVFRARESEIIDETARETRCVISTGGGAVLSEFNMQRLKESGSIVFLKTSPKILSQRLSRATHKLKNRPLFFDKKSVERLWKKRKPLYLKHADLTIDTGSTDIDAAINKILEHTSKS